MGRYLSEIRNWVGRALNTDGLTAVVYHGYDVFFFFFTALITLVTSNGRKSTALCVRTAFSRGKLAIYHTLLGPYCLTMKQVVWILDGNWLICGSCGTTTPEKYHYVLMSYLHCPQHRQEIHKLFFHATIWFATVGGCINLHGCLYDLFNNVFFYKCNLSRARKEEECTGCHQPSPGPWTVLPLMCHQRKCHY